MRALAISISISVLLLISACTPVSQHYRGKQVEQDDIIILQQGKHAGLSWQTFDVEINFDYLLDGKEIEITGVGRLGPHYRAMYTHISSFYVYLFFVDKDGVVLEAVLLPTHTMQRPGDQFKYHKSYVLPPATSALAFGYEGSVYEHEHSEKFFMGLFNNIHFNKHPR